MSHHRQTRSLRQEVLGASPCYMAFQGSLKEDHFSIF